MTTKAKNRLSQSYQSSPCFTFRRLPSVASGKQYYEVHDGVFNWAGSALSSTRFWSSIRGPPHPWFRARRSNWTAKTPLIPSRDAISSKCPAVPTYAETLRPLKLVWKAEEDHE